MPVNAVIDVNPAKQGRFLPATGLKVQSPEDALELYPARTSERFMFISIDQGN